MEGALRRVRGIRQVRGGVQEHALEAQDARQVQGPLVPREEEAQDDDRDGLAVPDAAGGWRQEAGEQVCREGSDPAHATHAAGGPLLVDKGGAVHMLHYGDLFCCVNTSSPALTYYNSSNY